MCKVTPMLLALLVSLSAGAQGVFVNQTNTALKIVIEDYPNHFSNIKGEAEAISTPESVVNYKSKVIIPGSVNCMLTESKTTAAYSWKCELYSSSDFTNAKERFNSLYKEIHNTIIKPAGEKPSILNGQYEDPDKNRKQNIIHFHFLPNTGVIQKLHVELQLQSEGGEWKIMLQVYEVAAESGNMQTMA
jgi:hypothetical protein